VVKQRARRRRCGLLLRVYFACLACRDPPPAQQEKTWLSGFDGSDGATSGLSPPPSLLPTHPPTPQAHQEDVNLHFTPSSPTPFSAIKYSTPQPHAPSDDDVIQYYEHSARKGSIDAQLTLAQLNLHGARGVPADLTRAFEFFSRAAAAGEPAAYSHLGHMYAQVCLLPRVKRGRHDRCP
jgi:hypothetical protein